MQAHESRRNRLPLPEPFHWPDGIQTHGRRLQVNPSNEDYAQALALALDALAASAGRLSDAAGALGVTASSLTRFLHAHGKAWAEANRIRHQHGHPPLKG